MKRPPELDDEAADQQLRMFVSHDGQVYIHADDMAEFLRGESVVMGERHEIKPRFLAPVFELLGIGVPRSVLHAAMSALTQMADIVDRMRRKALAKNETRSEEEQT